MTTLADKSLLSGGDNKPPMLEKHLYDSWKSIMELYMMNRPHGRMILTFLEKGPLVWPSITEDGVTRLKEYVELTPAEATQADCDIKAINIILQGLPTEIYALVSQLLSPLNDLGPSKKAQVATLDEGDYSQHDMVLPECIGEGHIAKQCTKPKRKRDETWFNDKVLLVQAQASGQALTEEEIAFLADPGLPDIQTSQTVITHNAAYQADDLDPKTHTVMNSIQTKMCSHVNLSRNGSDALTEVHNPDNLNYDLFNQSEQIMTSSEQSNDKLGIKATAVYGNTILKTGYYLLIPDSDETLELTEDSRSKMLLKEQDPLFEKHRVNTKPINYAILNNDYYKRFVRQTDFYSEHAYWKATSVPALDPSHSSTTIIVELLKKEHLATAITEGTWGYGYVKYHKKISQKRTRERMSDQEAKEIKAEARKIMPQPSTVKPQSTKPKIQCFIKFKG
ncbi:hypothetical protein Tco_1501002 [Tanacetum coccineum]